MLRRTLLAATVAAPALAPAARAQAPWAPTRPIRLIAPYPPGGGVDTTSRLLAGPMGAFLGQAASQGLAQPLACASDDSNLVHQTTAIAHGNNSLRNSASASTVHDSLGPSNAYTLGSTVFRSDRAVSGKSRICG